MTRLLVHSSMFAVCALALGGCRSLSMPEFWPFPERERTTFITPAMRSAAIAEFGARSTGVDSPEQREITDQLARQIQVEPDPLVRQEVIHAIAEFKTPMAQMVLEAGLADQDEMVRVACCEEIAERAVAGLTDPGYSAVPILAKALREDQDQNVRLAAAKALGSMKSPEAIQALTVALDDRDPAMQYVGVQSMKSVTGKDYGPSVEAWRQVAAGQTPAAPETPSIAERLRKVSPWK
jgi:HEAT repeat protein